MTIAYMRQKCMHSELSDGRMHFNKGGNVRYLYCHIFKRLKTGRKTSLKLK